ncbi:hypothetical protein DERF_008640 [Dermatophagoides farinae]|uniref:Uncharacterized protein n=1 Tax=Dermatophagoides farinae TaxID=6954 RepID=A0A922L9E3_DERFA|nr:hypothetical protein DERF_008640 [Dermatophagoides farinae]
MFLNKRTGIKNTSSSLNEITEIHVTYFFVVVVLECNKSTKCFCDFCLINVVHSFGHLLVTIFHFVNDMTHCKNFLKIKHLHPRTQTNAIKNETMSLSLFFHFIHALKSKRMTTTTTRFALWSISYK